MMVRHVAINRRNVTSEYHLGPFQWLAVSPTVNSQSNGVEMTDMRYGVSLINSDDHVTPSKSDAINMYADNVATTIAISYRRALITRGSTVAT